MSPTLTPRIAVYPGSFDPITLGHLDVVRRAAGIFDTVIVAVAHNGAKTGRYLFDNDTRLRLVRESVTGIPGVEAQLVPGLLADFCTSVGATAIIKGLRSGTDLDAEVPMALLNRDLGAPDTLFLVAAPTHAHVSSSLVKDVARNGGDVSNLVPDVVRRALTTTLGGSSQHTPGKDKP